MRFSESRLVQISERSDGTRIIGLTGAGKDFFYLDANGNLPEQITLSLDGLTIARHRHSLRDNSGHFRWQLTDDKPAIRSFLNDCGLKSGDQAIIQKISPQDYRLSPLWRPFTFIDLFAGIGGMRLGFQAVGGNCLFSSEWDESAKVTYQANFGELPAGDITQIDAKSIPKHDVLLAGFPCQPFSIIGNRNGFSDTRGTLFFEIERILRHHQPTALLLENVKQFRTHDEGRTCKTVLNTLEAMGYHTHIAILNALDFGVAQKRERAFIVGFRESIAFQFSRATHLSPTS